MKARYAREIRRGIVTAKDVMARRRARPQNMTPFGTRHSPPMPLWEQAYHHEMRRGVHDGRIRPPRGPAGGSRP